MAQPVLVKQSFLVAVLTGIQAVLPALVAALSLYVGILALGDAFDASAAVVPIVLCLTLIQAPREVGTQLTSERTIAVADALLRWLLLLGALLVLHLLTRSLDAYPARVYLLWAVMTPAALVATTLAMQAVMRKALMSAFGNRTAIVAGYNDSSLALARRLQTDPGMRIHVAGFFDDRNSDRLAMEADETLLGPLGDVARYVNGHGIDVIFIALPIRHVQRVMSLLDDLRDTTASIYYVPDIFVFDLIQARSGDVNGIPIVAMCETPFYGYRGVSKRLVDIMVSASILMLTVPLFAAIGLLVKLSSRGPVIFKQRRYGLDGHEIAVYKFRTMDVLEDGAKVRQASRTDERVTPVGRFLRRYSLDEIPQLVNVLQGRMSLVGPRPHAIAHNEQYRKLIKGYMVRHKVLPGITGLAQVNGCRGETSKLEDMEARVRYDLDYLRHWTLLLDIKILLLTVVRVFRDDKAY
ncbi:MAG TPA: undecaprenyl-phosphate glucose phosphotransferase [Steroidobacteraceae bacterium]|nr:undecaprenyl-phosphate glucose phosphotransferase [Steroidobacteraceae bacterium]